MGTGDKKRKRDEAVGEADAEQPKKVQIVAPDDADRKQEKKEKQSKKGEAKQKRSERKKKSAIEAQKGAAANRTSNSITAGSDELATGQDYISIGGPSSNVSREPTALTPFQRRERKASGSKRASPRSLRKQKKADQIATALAESGIMEETGTANGILGVDNTTSEATSSKPRFIVFVGNLPYDATTEQIQAHFAKLNPAAVRHQTDKATGKSKGFAFLEFTNYDRMKTCLQSYHNSIFDPKAMSNKIGTDEGDGPPRIGKKNNKRTRGRRLNVELTAGGGGNKSSGRKTKIKEKNKKLSEQRGRTKLKQAALAQEQKRAKILKAEKEAKKGGKRTGANAEAVGGGGGSDGQAQPDMGTIHPSRLARVRA